ncbi:MAG: NUDIX domain-containing protein [Acidimicrobiales bacterium]
MTTALLTADLLVFAPDNHDQLHMLAILRAEDSDAFPNMWAIPGGHLDDREGPEDAAVREAREETGVLIEPADIHPVGVYATPDRDPRGRVVSFAYAVLLDHMPPVQAADDAAEARWICTHCLTPGRPPAEPADTPAVVQLAFDHNRITLDGLKVVAGLRATA